MRSPVLMAIIMMSSISSISSNLRKRRLQALDGGPSALGHATLLVEDQDAVERQGGRGEVWCLGQDLALELVVAAPGRLLAGLSAHKQAYVSVEPAVVDE